MSLSYLLPACKTVFRGRTLRSWCRSFPRLYPTRYTDTIKLCVYLPFLSAAIERRVSTEYSHSHGQGHGRKLDINGTRISRLRATKAITPVPVSRHWRLSWIRLRSFLVEEAVPFFDSFALCRLPCELVGFASKETDREEQARRALRTLLQVHRWVNLAAVLGSAAACRGERRPTAARTVSFLADLACSKRSAGDLMMMTLPNRLNCL
jgi:hypothetical protein